MDSLQVDIWDSVSLAVQSVEVHPASSAASALTTTQQYKTGFLACLRTDLM